MPTLDKRVTVRIHQVGDDGRPTSTTTDIGVWATVADSGSIDLFNAAGSISQRKRFTIRWRRDVIDAGPTLLSLVDSNGHAFTIDTVEEDPDRRRRFLILEGFRV